MSPSLGPVVSAAAVPCLWGHGAGWVRPQQARRAVRRFLRWVAVALSGLGLLSAPALGSTVGKVLAPEVLKRLTVEELLQQKVISVSRRSEPLGRAASSVFVIRGEGAQIAGATR
ncbi:MAG TPA: hypothetical protein VHF69_02555, partial [Candidatus Synoicihabitans sp.]|nr:hypothetical protein [Candidatus Synoicihabitans sp.]